MTFTRPAMGVVLVRIAGEDTGQLGEAPFKELADDLFKFAPIELFCDVSEAFNPTMPVQSMWTEWFAKHRGQLKGVNMLVKSKYMHLTAEVAKHFSRTGDLIRVYLDPQPFNEAIGRAAPSFTRR